MTRQNERQGDDTHKTQTGGGANDPAARSQEKAKGEQSKTSGRATTPAKHKPGRGGDSRRRRLTTNCRRATTRQKGNKGKRGARSQRPRNENSPGGGGHNRRRTRRHQELMGGRRQQAEGWGGVEWGGRSTRRRQTPAHSQEPRRHKKAEAGQGNTSGRATTPAKQKHRVAHGTRSRGWPVRPGQETGVTDHTRSGDQPVRRGQANTTDT